MLGRIARPGHAICGQKIWATKGHHQQRDDQGWGFVHIAIDDATRLAYIEVLNDEKTVRPRRARGGRRPSPPWRCVHAVPARIAVSGATRCHYCAYFDTRLPQLMGT